MKLYNLRREATPYSERERQRSKRLILKDRQRYKETEIKRERGTDIWYYEAVDSEGEGYALLSPSLSGPPTNICNICKNFGSGQMRIFWLDPGILAGSGYYGKSSGFFF